LWESRDEKPGPHSGVFIVPSMRSHHRNLGGLTPWLVGTAGGGPPDRGPTYRELRRFTQALKSLQRAGPSRQPTDSLSTSSAQ